MKKKNLILLLGLVSFMVVILGVSFAFFTYNKDVADVSLTTGEISINLSNINGTLSITDLIPKSDTEGINADDYIDFTVDSVVDSEKIYYEVYILPKTGNTLDTSYIKTYLTDQSNNQIKGVTLYNSLSDSEKENGKRLYRGVVEINNDYTKKTESKDFRLRLWLDESYNETAEKMFDFDIYLYAYNVPEDFEIPTGVNMVRKAITAKINAETNACNPIWVDDMGTTSDDTDDITYFSGTNDCVDMNYVWYSGKLWRITAIYPDGAMKLVTENMITSIAFNKSGQVNFWTDENTTSYMYQWLNEDFYDTLYNAEEFIDTTKLWNATLTTRVRAKPTETNMVPANVGLLNSYEYYNSYRKATDSTGYLNIGYYWWLLNPSPDPSCVWYVYYLGYSNYYFPTDAYGGRPSIYLKSGLEFTGNGTIDSPYKIVGDKDSGSENDLINTRLSGEYVKLANNENEQVFRIIGVEDNKTKIIAMDYADNKATRKFSASSSDTLWGSGTTIDADTWYTYLNDTYLPNLKNTYGELFDNGMYYLGASGYNYKLSVCANTTSGSIKNCIENSQVGTNNTFNIGLPRYGEMFATQQSGGYSNSIDMWLMNRYSTSRVWVVYSHGRGIGVDDTPSNARGGRPTVHLKSSVKIISGTGTESDPYVVGL